MAPTIIDQEGKLRTTAYCLVYAEDHGSIRWQVKQLINTDPLLPTENAANMSDGFFYLILKSMNLFLWASTLNAKNIWSLAIAQSIGLRLKLQKKPALCGPLLKQNFPINNNRLLQSWKRSALSFMKSTFYPQLHPNLKRCRFTKCKKFSLQELVPAALLSP